MILPKRNRRLPLRQGAWAQPCCQVQVSCGDSRGSRVFWFSSAYRAARRRIEWLELVEMSHQFVFRGPAYQVELNHLQSTNRGLPPHPETDQQTGDDGQVDLDLNAVAAVGQ